MKINYTPNWKNILFALFILLVFSIVVLHIIPYIMNVQHITRSTNDEQIITKNANEDKCKSILTEGKREFCYFANGDCLMNENLLYKYMCERQKIRVHMWSFINTPDSISDNKLENISCCRDKKGYEKYYDLINLAAKRFNISDYADESYCSQIIDESQNGECKLFLAISAISELTMDPIKNYYIFLDYCSSFKNPSWRSECYYLIADELTLNSFSDEYFDKIVRACEESDKAHPYNCINHNAQLMGNRVLDFCSLVPEEKKGDCFEAYGKLNSANSTKIDFSICDNTNYKKDCIFGVLENANLKLNIQNRNKYLDACANISDELKDMCFESFGNGYFYIQFSKEDFENIKEHCNLVPSEFINSCYMGIIGSLNHITKSNLTESLKYCANLEESYEEFCYKELIPYLSRYMGSNPLKDIDLCLQFPPNYQERCTNFVIDLAEQGY